MWRANRRCSSDARSKWATLWMVACPSIEVSNREIAWSCAARCCSTGRPRCSCDARGRSMLEKVIAWCVRRRFAALLVVSAVAAYGVHACLRTPIEAFPDVTNLQVSVIAQAPGLAPEEVERQLTIP